LSADRIPACTGTQAAAAKHDHHSALHNDKCTTRYVHSRQECSEDANKRVPLPAPLLCAPCCCQVHELPSPVGWPMCPIDWSTLIKEGNLAAAAVCPGALCTLQRTPPQLSFSFRPPVIDSEGFSSSSRGFFSSKTCRTQDSYIHFQAGRRLKPMRNRRCRTVKRVAATSSPRAHAAMCCRFAQGMSCH
jgi:hypothetical protein